MTSARPQPSRPHPDSDPAAASEPRLAAATALESAVPAGWPPPGTPFHRLGPIVGRGRWWAAATALVGVSMLEAGLTGLSPVIDRLPDAGLPVLGAWTRSAVLLAAIGVLAPVVLVLAGPGQRRPAGTVWSVTVRPRWALLAQSVAVALVLFVLVRFVVLYLPLVGLDGWVGWPAFAAPFAALMLVLTGQVVAEELLFRGLVMQAVGGFFASPWPPVVVQAGLWTVAHWPSSLWGAVNVASVGLILGAVTVRTGGLEIAVAAHLAWNTVTHGLLVAFHPPPTGQAPTDKNMGDLPAVAAIFDLALVAAAVYLIYLWAIDHNLAPTNEVEAR
jgi:membrane protease YdiL (CAAX protease family)